MDSVPAQVKAMPTFLLNQAALSAQRLVAEGMSALGAHRTHFSLLASLEEFGPASQATLTRRTGIDRSDMVALVNRLAEDGFVQREPDPEDRRRNVVTITRAGRQQLRRLDRALGAIGDELLAPLTPRQREELLQMLIKIVAVSPPSAQPSGDERS